MWLTSAATRWIARLAAALLLTLALVTHVLAGAPTGTVALQHTTAAGRATAAYAYDMAANSSLTTRVARTGDATTHAAAEASVIAPTSEVSAEPAGFVAAETSGQVLKGPIADAIPKNLPEQLALNAAKEGRGTQIMANLGDTPRLVAK